MRARCWSFTHNNPQEFPELEDFPGATYLIFSEEQGDDPQPNIPQDELGLMGHHTQGCVYFRALKSKQQVIDMWPGHWSISRDIRQAIAYCDKVRTNHPEQQTHRQGPTEQGTMPKQGKRSDLIAVKELIDANTPMPEIWDRYTSVMLRYHKGFVLYNNIRKATPKRAWVMNIIVLWGDSGAGKTKDAMAMFPEPYILPSPKSSGLWWDYYQGQDTVIIDEMTGNLCTPEVFLKITDRYPYTCDIHGGAGSQLLARNIVITSQNPPDSWWPNRVTGQRLVALKRRLTEVRHYTLGKGYEIERGYGEEALLPEYQVRPEPRLAPVIATSTKRKLWASPNDPAPSEYLVAQSEDHLYAPVQPFEEAPPPPADPDRPTHYRKGTYKKAKTIDELFNA